MSSHVVYCDDAEYVWEVERGVEHLVILVCVVIGFGRRKPFFHPVLGRSLGYDGGSWLISTGGSFGGGGWPLAAFFRGWLACV
eukprot:12576793-Ditylum_brightwellii.AAC.1